MLVVPRHLHVLPGEVHGDRILTTRRRRALVVLGALVAAAVVYGAVVWNRIDRIDADLPGSGGDGTVYLLVGSDRREDVPGEDPKRFGTADEVPGERADIVILVHARPDGSVRALSVPRDLVLFRDGGGPERLAPMLGDGAGAIADAVCHSLGIGIDHVAIVHFAGLTELVDVAGGVTITPPATLLDRSSGLLVTAGRQRVDGRTALAYVRARHIERREGDEWVADPVESARRGERAMEVLRGVGSAVDLGWNPWLDHRLAWAVTGSVAVDDDMGPGDLLGLGSAVRGLDGGRLETLPAITRAGDVPIASLTPGAGAAIDRFTAGAEAPDRCATPALLGTPP